jgi:ribosomal protein S18 acetylase RimI-like enzyme
MKSIQIQEMTIQDYDEVYALWRETEGIKLSEVDGKNDIKRLLELNPGLSFVARDGDQLVGAVLCTHDGRRGYIDHLAVRESHRRQGIGKGLAARCLYNLMRVGIRKMHLFVQEDNKEAIAFWRQLGWAERVELLTMSRNQLE